MTGAGWGSHGAICCYQMLRMMIGGHCGGYLPGFVADVQTELLRQLCSWHCLAYQLAVLHTFSLCYITDALCIDEDMQGELLQLQLILV